MVLHTKIYFTVKDEIQVHVQKDVLRLIAAWGNIVLYEEMNWYESYAGVFINVCVCIC